MQNTLQIVELCRHGVERYNMDNYFSVSWFLVETLLVILEIVAATNFWYDWSICYVRISFRKVTVFVIR